MFIHKHRTQWPVRIQCRVLGVSCSGYYAWRGRDTHVLSPEEQVLQATIQKLHAAHHRSLGTRRMKTELAKHGIGAGRLKLSRRMKELGLRSVHTPRRRVSTTDSAHTLATKENILNREFDVAEPNSVWVSDITYIEISGRFLYLAVVIDVFSRRVIGYTLAQTMHAELVLEALEQAWERRGFPRNVLVHSDRGSQYASHAVAEFIETRMHGIQSMSRKANCWDNAVAESFFKTLKVEFLYHMNYTTIQEVKLGLFRYIDVYYNDQRPHSTLGNSSPASFESNHYQRSLSIT